MLVIMKLTDRAKGILNQEHQGTGQICRGPLMIPEARFILKPYGSLKYALCQVLSHHRHQ